MASAKSLDSWKSVVLTPFRLEFPVINVRPQQNFYQRTFIKEMTLVIMGFCFLEFYSNFKGIYSQRALVRF